MQPFPCVKEATRQKQHISDLTIVRESNEPLRTTTETCRMKIEQTKLEVHHQIYLEQCQPVSHLQHITKQHYISWNMIRTDGATNIPSYVSNKHLVKLFSSYYTDDTVKIRTELKSIQGKQIANP